MKNKFTKRIFIIIIIILTMLLSLFIYKNIHTSKQLITINSILKNNQIIIAAGNIGSFPILLISRDSGKTWSEKKISITSLIPSNSNYSLNNKGNIVWINEFKACIECDSNNKVKNSYYSYDFGNNWNSTPCFKSFLSGNHLLSFYSEKEGEIINLNEERKVTSHTIDGGVSWKKGKLNKKLINTKIQTTKIEVIYFEKKQEKYILQLKKNDSTYLEIGALSRKMDLLN